ncbi:tail fiber protein [Pseudomonas sp. EKM23D]|nr:tail fiber protein [Pseudomonas sp. EKM23D]
MTFLRGTSFGFHFGIDTDNKFKRGGISLGNSSYEIWDEFSLPLATKQQAEGGTDLKSVMTPARVAQAITKQVPAASETAVGIAAIATQPLVDAGSDDSTIITPKKLKARLTAWFAQATESVLGAVRISTQFQAEAGADDATAVTPLKVRSVLAARGLWDSSANVGNLGSGSAVSTGLYGSNGATNSPAYAQINTMSVAWGQNPNFISQLALGANSNRMFMRSFNKTTSPSAPWVEFFGTGNVSLVGAVVGFMSPNAPLGWLKANGSAVSRTTYADLFALIGTGFGAGDGSTTFNVPDLRAEFLRGYDDGRGQDPGRTLGNAQAASVESHTHTILNMASSFSFSAAGGGNAPGGQSTAATQAYGGSETRPRNVNVLFCIKY